MQHQEHFYRPDDQTAPAIMVSVFELALLIASDPNVIRDFKRQVR